MITKDKHKTTTAIISYGEIVIVYEDDFVNLSSHEYHWVIDFVASFDVTPHHDYFTSYTIRNFGPVMVGDQEVSKVVRIREIWLETNVDCKPHLKNIRHLHDICLITISI